MVESVRRAGRRAASRKRAAEAAAGQAMARSAAGYAAVGWPVCAGAQAAGREPRRGGDRACSCDRVGCPAPGAHPLSPAWKLQASTDPAVVARWWSERPRAGIILATGRTFDVLDVPAAAGLRALASLERAATRPGPVALSAGERALFFVATRASAGSDDEWWSCHLDCEPETVPAVNGLRWHCRDSYVLAPPSPLTTGLAARWVIAPGGERASRPLPDALRLLEHLADACEESIS